jgi:hypothetical protein
MCLAVVELESKGEGYRRRRIKGTEIQERGLSLWLVNFYEEKFSN